MSQYPFKFIGSIVALLIINVGCNDKNSQDSDFDPNLKRKKRETIDKENTKILFNYPEIHSGTCSTYKINSTLGDKFVNKNLELIDKGGHFTLDKESQKVCAYKKDVDNKKTPAPIYSSAQLIFGEGQGQDKIFAEIKVKPGTIKITEIIKQFFDPKNPYSDDPILRKPNSFYIPAGGTSDNFSIAVYNNGSRQAEPLPLNSDEVSIVSKHIKSGSLVEFPLTRVGNTPVDSWFYFQVPTNFSHGRYDLTLRVNKEAPNVEQLITIYVVEKDKNLNSPPIKSIYVTHDNKTTTDISIPIAGCVDYKVIAVDLNDKKHNITEEDWYTVPPQEQEKFTLNRKDSKICAYGHKYATPSIDEVVNFTISYQNLTPHHITLRAQNSPYTKR